MPFQNIKPNNHTKGFTLIELMVAVLIIGIITLIGVPNLSILIEKNRLKTANNSVYLILQAARNNAITSQKRIVVCPSTDGKLCNTAATPAWNQYLIAYREASSTGFTRSNTEELIRTVKINNQVTVTTNKKDIAYAYLANGEVIGDANSKMVDFTVNDNISKTKKAYKIALTRSGAITTSSFAAP